MFKNTIIIIQFFIIFSLMVQKPQNLDIIVKDVATAKEMVVDGAEYLHKTFDKEFSVHEEKTSFNPFEQNKAATSNVFIKEQTIIEDTWFNEK